MIVLRPIVALRPPGGRPGGRPTAPQTDRTPMPLTPPVQRERLHTRSVVGDGYQRSDGMFDLEARLVDTKSHPYPLMSGVREPGEPIHDLWIRVTIDRDCTIHAVDASMPSIPYPGGCERGEAVYQKLVGANLLHGFRRLVTDRLGGVHGCTHLTEVVGSLPTLAVQMFAGLVREIEGTDKPFQLDRCHALDTRSETVHRYYPQWYRGAA